MNEKIKEIMYITDEIDIPNDEYFCDTDFLADIDPRRVEKFAELIVRECIRIQHERFCEYGHEVSPDVVLEHFGFKTYWDRQLELFNERKD